MPKLLRNALALLAGLAVLIAATHKVPLAFAIGAVFLCGGIAASFMIPAPKWFIALDLLGAYLPMAWVGIQAGSRMTQDKAGQRG